MVNIFFLQNISNKYSDDFISYITLFCSKCLMQRETTLLKLLESIIMENIYFKLETKHKSNTKNAKEEKE